MLYRQHILEYLFYGLSVLLLLLAIDVYKASRRAFEAEYKASVCQARLDRLCKALGVGMRETRAVPYEKGWSPRETWDDDFSRTTYLPKQSTVAWYVSLLTWLLRKVN